MAFDEQTLVNLLWGNTVADDTNWYLGVYLTGTDPVADLTTAEDTSADRVQVGVMAWSTDHLSNSAEVYIGPFSGGTLDGWFITYGDTSVNVAWYAPFGASIDVSPGEYLLFDPGTINLNMANG
jgi:hypothetical protein